MRRTSSYSQIGPRRYGQTGHRSNGTREVATMSSTTESADDPAAAAAQRILAAAEAEGIPRNEVLTVVKAVYTVRTGGVTSVALIDGPTFRRRRLAHVVGTELYDPTLEPEEVYRAVVGELPPSRRTQAS
jgi:hypothetical protein